MKTMRRTFTLIILACVFTTLLVPKADAASLANYNTNNSGWLYHNSTTKIHMGQINSTYYLKGGTTTYDDTFDSAVDSWGYSFLTMSRKFSESSAICIVQFGETRYDLQMVQCKNYESSSGHITKVDMFIDQALFSSGIGSLGRERVFMAGIGAAYGLGCRTSGTCVMNRLCYTGDTPYPDSPSSNELRAIKVLTHQHTHNASSSTMTISTNDSSTHKCTCSYCHTYMLASHGFMLINNVYKCSACGYISVQ